VLAKPTVGIVEPVSFDSPDSTSNSNFDTPIMFAIIEDGSRQYRVEEGAELTVDYRVGSEAGQSLSFDRVLLANGGGNSLIGKPVLDGATVEAEIIDPIFKGEKLEIQKIRRRKNSRTHTGHRQKHTIVRVTSINVPGLEVADASGTGESAD